jgi:hypothetical protein
MTVQRETIAIAIMIIVVERHQVKKIMSTVVQKNNKNLNMK